MTPPPLPDTAIPVRLEAAFFIRKGASWWPPTRNRYVASRSNSFNPEFAWTDGGLQFRVLRRQLVPYAQVTQVDVFALGRLVQRGWVVSSDRTGVVVTLETSGSLLLAVPSTASQLRLALAQAASRGVALGADAQALLAA